jgi:hypothetical protein
MVYPANNMGVPTTNRSFAYSAGGLNSVGEYMASGLPFSEYIIFNAGSLEHVQFPYVSSEIYLKNDGDGDLFVGWTKSGVEGTNKYRLVSGESVTFRIRIKDLYLSASAICTGSITAALTQITKDQFPVLTGSLASENGWAAFVTGSGPKPGFGYDGIG